MLQEMKLEDALKKFLRGEKSCLYRIVQWILEADKPAFSVRWNLF